ncbi:unnamed protein product [Brassicogethes aeneus]|uniref:Sodium channel protein Nach n=1 Tax=Brassicogethes aeneus TaxID=1431903 RepID=A0A9P0B300_BRAAE|nr:unnamed protein product [Brassicogethes aeneus]
MRLRTKKKPKKNKNLKYTPSNYKLLKTSWNVQTKEFFEHSTLHGVRYIAEDGRPFFEKILWFVCVTVGAVATVVIIISLWEKFQTNPTITGLDTDFHNWKVPFPGLTVCQETPSSKENIEAYLNERMMEDPDIDNSTDTIDYLQALTNLSLDNIDKFVKIPIKIDFIKKEKNLRSLVFNLMNKCEDVFDTCTWKSYNYSCCEGFFPVFTENGFCYTFNSRQYERRIPWSEKLLPEFEQKYIKETDLKWSLQFKVKNSDIVMPIYILNSDEMAGIDVQPQHIWDFKVNTISFSVKQTYTTEDTKQLSVKQRHCAFDKEIPLQFGEGYTYTTCTVQCRINIAFKLCNCIPHFYPLVKDYTHCQIEGLKCIAMNLKNIKKMDKCGCVLGCLNTVYEVEKLNEHGEAVDDTAALEAEFVSWPMLRYKREVLFGWVDLLGVEIIYYFTMRACCMVVREKDTLEKINLEEASKPPTDYDLSLVPYFLSDPLPGNGINEIIKTYHNDADGVSIMSNLVLSGYYVKFSSFWTWFSMV